MLSNDGTAAAPTLLKQWSVYQHQLKSIDIANIKQPGKPSSAFSNEPTRMKSQFGAVCFVFAAPCSHQELPPGYLRTACLHLCTSLLWKSHTWTNSSFNFPLGAFCILFKTTCCAQCSVFTYNALLHLRLTTFDLQMCHAATSASHTSAEAARAWWDFKTPAWEAAELVVPVCFFMHDNTFKKLILNDSISSLSAYYLGGSSSSNTLMLVD